MVALLVTVVSVLLAARLRVDSDLRRLLPRDHPVVLNLERIEETFGSTGSVNIVLRDGDAEARHALTEAIAARFEGHPQLRDVDYQLPSEFFTQHALYYLTDQELEELDERIQAWLHYEFCSEARGSCVTDPDPQARERLETFVAAKRKEAEARTGFKDFYEREGIPANVMLLRPTQAAASLEFARAITDDVLRGVQEVYERPGAPWAGKGVRYNVVGPYVNKTYEQEIIRRDTVRGTTFAAVGVILIVFMLFRSMRAVLVLMVPLTCGVSWSLAATYLVIGDLNTMTSLISTVVMGSGIDGGIHFYSDARRHRRSMPNAEAIRQAFDRLIVPLLVASSTTIGAFLIMAVSEFPGFREFGIISAMGVMLCLLAMTTVLPALTHAVGIKAPPAEPRRLGKVPAHALLARPGLLLSGLALVSLVAAISARDVEFEFNGRALQSDSTYARTHEDTQLISRIFGQDIHAGILVRPSLEEARSALERARAARQTYVDQGSSVVAELFAVTDLLPPENIDPAARRVRIEALLEEDELARLEEIAGVESKLRRKKMLSDGASDDFDDVDDGEADPSGEDEADDGATKAAEDDLDDGHADSSLVAGGSAPGEPGAPEAGRGLTREDARLLLAMLDAEPVTVDALPPPILRRLRSDDGSFGIFAYPAFDAADMRKGVDFMRETRDYLPADATDIFVGETTVYAAMFLLLRKEAPIVLSLAALFITVVVYWQLRSVRHAVMTLLPLSLAMLWLVGLMGATGLRFTLFNLPILPAILGIGVDNGVYLTDRIRKTKDDVRGLQKALEETGGSIMAAMATTAVGFGAFILADSAGVRGIGLVAVLGIVLAALAATMVLPALTRFGRAVQARRRRDSR